MSTKLAIVITALLAAANAETTCRYRLQADTSSVRVSLELSGLRPGPRVLIIPKAVPMGYGDQPYDRFVSGVEAYSVTGEALRVERSEGPRWKLGHQATTVGKVQYEVDIARMEKEILSAADSSRRRPRYLSLLGYSVFGYVEGLEEAPVSLQAEGLDSWPIFLTLKPTETQDRGRAEATAVNFYALADSQIAMGPALVVRRAPSKAPMFLATYDELGGLNAVMDRVAREAAYAMDAVAEYFGTTPFPHYTVQMEMLRPVSTDHRYGFSMEHMESATFYLGEEMALNPGTQEAIWRRHRFNFAHHMAHAWIPKRSYPSGYFPFSWELTPVLDTIWLSEGWAQYAAMSALRDKLEPAQREAFMKTSLDRFQAVLGNSPAFLKRMPLVELSRVGSTRYSEDFRVGRLLFSRGGLMAEEMDRHIVSQTQGKKSFRDALRALVAWSLRERKPFRVEDLPSLFREATGAEVGPVIQRWLAPLKE
ncbi:MAG: hypothetical protein FJW20_15860 [Acidimicrobiia bacterium]|nr:hypothetical protein [Acidimicrobiia bacterium]